MSTGASSVVSSINARRWLKKEHRWLMANSRSDCNHIRDCPRVSFSDKSIFRKNAFQMLSRGMHVLFWWNLFSLSFKQSENQDTVGESWFKPKAQSPASWLILHLLEVSVACHERLCRTSSSVTPYVQLQSKESDENISWLRFVPNVAEKCDSWYRRKRNAK